MTETAFAFLQNLHPYDMLSTKALQGLSEQATRIDVAKDDDIYRFGETLDGLYIILGGRIQIRDAAGTEISQLQRKNSFGERGLLKDGVSVTAARALEPSQLICIPAAVFHKLRADSAAFRQFFSRGTTDGQDQPALKSDLSSVAVATLMARNPVTCGPDMTIKEAAALMQARRISCLCIVGKTKLIGIATTRDLSGKALARGLPHNTAIGEIMTANPRTLPPTAIGSDVLHLMMEHKLGHLPIVLAGKLVGIVTQTDLTRFQASSTAIFVSDAAHAPSVADLANVTRRIPELLVQLLASGHRHDIVTRMITDIADVVTRRLLAMAEEKYGPPPSRYLWLACGSQGRQEQTGVSDQDNCLILEDGLSENQLAYFEPFARFVCDGLDACGYIYCPGDMMATNPRWRQPVSVWRDYFDWWIKSPSKEAQMLASVMFDLRAIGGDEALFQGLKSDTLAKAAANSIFTAHMASNALTQATPLGLLRGLVTIKSGEHRNKIDLKHNGVVPVVDLGRMYALQGKLEAVNTRARIGAAIASGVVSESGGRDLLDAYDLVAQTRLQHQATSIKLGKAPDNFLSPLSLSDFERSHLRDAFVVIKTMQSALMQARGVLG